VSGSAGGLFTINANGSYSYNPNGQFDSLRPGQTATDTITYVASDGSNTDTATFTVTITGANDAPLLSGDLSATINEGDMQDAYLHAFEIPPCSPSMTLFRSVYIFHSLIEAASFGFTKKPETSPPTSIRFPLSFAPPLLWVALGAASPTTKKNLNALPNRV